MLSFRIRPLVCKRQNQSGTKTLRIHHESGTISSSVNLAWIIKCANIHLWVSLGHPITVCFAELFFTSLTRISALNPKSRHYVTLATPRAVPGRRAQEFMWRKVVPLARVTLPAEVRTRPPELSRLPRRVRVPNVNSWLKFGKKQAQRYFGWSNSGGRVVSGTRDHINGA